MRDKETKTGVRIERGRKERMALVRERGGIRGGGGGWMTEIERETESVRVECVVCGIITNLNQHYFEAEYFSFVHT